MGHRHSRSRDRTGKCDPSGDAHRWLLGDAERRQGGHCERPDLEFRGAKAVRAFDALVVIVALRGRADDRRCNLIGSSEATEEEVARGGVLAMLDATNRILERYAKS